MVPGVSPNGYMNKIQVQQEVTNREKVVAACLMYGGAVGAGGGYLLLGIAMIAAAFSLPLLRFLLGNRLMGFLSAISLQFYIWHQFLAVRIKEWDFIPHQMQSPWMMGEYPWQVKYTLICFLLAIVLAGLITYLFEKPITRKLRK